jgi:hypothetical protein
MGIGAERHQEFTHWGLTGPRHRHWAVIQEGTHPVLLASASLHTHVRPVWGGHKAHAHHGAAVLHTHQGHIHDSDVRGTITCMLPCIWGGGWWHTRPGCLVRDCARCHGLLVQKLDDACSTSEHHHPHDTCTTHPTFNGNTPLAEQRLQPVTGRVQLPLQEPYMIALMVGSMSLTAAVTGMRKLCLLRPCTQVALLGRMSAARSSDAARTPQRSAPWRRRQVAGGAGLRGGGHVPQQQPRCFRAALVRALPPGRQQEVHAAAVGPRGGLDWLRARSYLRPDQQLHRWRLRSDEHGQADARWGRTVATAGGHWTVAPARSPDRKRTEHLRLVRQAPPWCQQCIGSTHMLQQHCQLTCAGNELPAFCACVLSDLALTCQQCRRCS